MTERVYSLHPWKPLGAWMAIQTEIMRSMRSIPACLTCPKLPAPQGRSNRMSSNCSSHSASGPEVMLVPLLLWLGALAEGPLADGAARREASRRMLHCRRSEARCVDM